MAWSRFARCCFSFGQACRARISGRLRKFLDDTLNFSGKCPKEYMRKWPHATASLGRVGMWILSSASWLDMSAYGDKYYCDEKRFTDFYLNITIQRPGRQTSTERGNGTRGFRDSAHKVFLECWAFATTRYITRPWMWGIVWGISSWYPSIIVLSGGDLRVFFSARYEPFPIFRA